MLRSSFLIHSTVASKQNARVDRGEQPSLFEGGCTRTNDTAGAEVRGLTVSDSVSRVALIIFAVPAA